MFPNRPLVGDVIGGTRLTVPIGGTLRQPKIDKEAFRETMAETGKEMLIRGAAGLLFRLGKPREQPAVPRPSAEERRARRKERRAQKREGMPR
jgi:translocation and assembly module TamB